MKKKVHNKSGFTIIELLVAVLIISIGFLGLSQMGYLSLRQKHLAETGTDAANVIQFVTDRDLAEIKRLHLLNTKTYQDALTVKSLNLSYCDGDSEDPCAACPCDPLNVLTTNTDPTPVGSADVITMCSVINMQDLDPDLIFNTDETTCRSNMNTQSADENEIMIMVREASTTVTNGTASTPSTVVIDMTYAVKSIQQFIETGLSTDLKDSLARDVFTVTAHEENYSDDAVVLSGWTDVRIPHVP